MGLATVRRDGFVGLDTEPAVFSVDEIRLES